MAKLVCAHCNKAFHSLMVIPEKALEELTKALMDHLEKEHKEHFNSIIPGSVRAAELAIWLIAIARNTKTLDETNDKILRKDIIAQQFNKQMEQLMNLIGIEDIDEDEEGDEDDEGSKDKTNETDDGEDIDTMVPEEATVRETETAESELVKKGE